MKKWPFIAAAGVGGVILLSKKKSKKLTPTRPQLPENFQLDPHTKSESPPPPRAPSAGPAPPSKVLLYDLEGIPKRVLSRLEPWKIFVKVADLGSAPADFRVTFVLMRSQADGTAGIKNSRTTAIDCKWSGTVLKNFYTPPEGTGNWKGPYQSAALSVRRKGNEVIAMVAITEVLKKTMWHVSITTQFTTVGP